MQLTRTDLFGLANALRDKEAALALEILEAKNPILKMNLENARKGNHDLQVKIEKLIGEALIYESIG